MYVKSYLPNENTVFPSLSSAFSSKILRKSFKLFHLKRTLIMFSSKEFVNSISVSNLHVISIAFVRHSFSAVGTYTITHTHIHARINKSRKKNSMIFR